MTGDFDPGKEAAVPGANAFNGAGLLVWQSDGNYLRLERDIWTTATGQSFSYAPLFEYWKDNQLLNPRGGTTATGSRGKSIYLRLTRRGSELTGTASLDGSQWLPEQTVTTALPPKPQLGVSAINTSKKPFSVEFSEFQLTSK